MSNFFRKAFTQLKSGASKVLTGAKRGIELFNAHKPLINKTIGFIDQAKGSFDRIDQLIPRNETTDKFTKSVNKGFNFAKNIGTKAQDIERNISNRLPQAQQILAGVEKELA